MKKTFISKTRAVKLFKSLISSKITVKITFKNFLFFRYYILEY